MAAIGINLKISSYTWHQFLEVLKNKKAQIWEDAGQRTIPMRKISFSSFIAGTLRRARMTQITRIPSLIDSTRAPFR